MIIDALGVVVDPRRTLLALVVGVAMVLKCAA